MDLLTLSFPSQADTLAKRKFESRANAGKFIKALGLDNELEVTQIKEGVFGCTIPGDTSDDILVEAKKFGGKVQPFVESVAVEVKEGTWISLREAAAGMQFTMKGTEASNPREGSVRPGKYFVLGIEESNGGKYATLGRVDQLSEIGRSSGLGKYVYNVDLSILSAAVDVSAKNESVKPQKESVIPQDRSLEVLDMLLENDPYVLAENARNKQTKSEEPTLEELLNIGTEMSSQDLKESKKDGKKVIAESKAENEIADEGMDPELFIESRTLVAALEEAGYDVDAMTDQEFDEAVDTLLAQAASDSEEGSAGKEAEEAPEAEDEAAEDTSTKEETDEEQEVEGEPKDEAFEAAEAEEDKQEG